MSLDVIQLIKNDHWLIKQLFSDYSNAKENQEKENIVANLILLIYQHSIGRYWFQSSTNLL